MKIIQFFLLLLAVATLNSCSILDQLGQSSKRGTGKPLTYLNNAPRYNVKKFLDGDLEGFAIIQDAKGEITDSFTAKIDGSWEENRGTVKYSFRFNDGKKDARTWLITIDSGSKYTAVGHDFVTPAIGRQEGNVSEIFYSLNKDHKGRKKKVNFEDRLYLVDENSAIVTSEMTVDKKVIGKITLSLRKIKKAPKKPKQEDPEVKDTNEITKES